MTHTYLLEEGLWQVKGYFADSRAQRLPISGEVKVWHEEECWFNRSEMMLNQDPKMSFCNLYEIEPLNTGLESTIWETQHARLGLIIGTLVILDDAMIMSYTAEGGHFSGTETLYQEAADRYKSWGVMWQGDQKISSWQAQVIRQP